MGVIRFNFANQLAAMEHGVMELFLVSCEGIYKKRVSQSDPCAFDKREPLWLSIPNALLWQQL